ncbi:MAG TPA: hypothetical protein VNR38_04390 [Ureibacillus sp.]|nr:hypothetical protein [Ureibacillus sp.]
MLFQSFTKKQNEIVIEKDIFDQLQYMVVTLLKREFPMHYEGNHILYTANLRLEELKQLASYHRKKINLDSSIGQFHKDAYEMTIKNSNQLQLLIDSYISLHIESDRERLNHRLSFKDRQVTSLYNELSEYNEQKVLPSLQDSYWKAFKEDLLPLLAEIR